jgi:hypothetical protein
MVRFTIKDHVYGAKGDQQLSVHAISVALVSESPSSEPFVGEH